MENLHLKYYPPEQAKAEAGFVRQRRQAGRDGAADPDDQETIKNSLGLALSGGGIRSATFNLGLLQSLAAAGQLKDFDFLSTVSGGGYIGACLGRLYQRSADEHEQAGKGKPDAAQTASDVEQVLASDEAPLIRWLRDHGRYLAPQGLRDRLFALAIYLRNMLTVHVLLGMLLLFVFLFWGMLQTAMLLLLQPAGLADLLREHPRLLEFMRLDLLSPAAEPWKLQIGKGYSPAWLLAGLGLISSMACSWAYWMHRHESKNGQDSAGLEQRWVALALALVSAAALFYQQDPPALLATLLWAGLLTAPSALTFSFCAARLEPLEREAARPLEHRSARRASIRNSLTAWLRQTTMLLLGLLLFALTDEAAHHAYRWLTDDSRIGSSLLLGGGLGGALLAGLRAFAQALAASQATRRAAAGASRWVLPAVNALGILVLAGVIFFWALAAVSSVAYLQQAGSLLDWVAVPWRLLALLLLLGALICSNRHPDLLNLSSLHQFYSARLARAYLGPGNRARGVPWAAHPVKAQAGQLRRVDEVVKGDDMPWASYCPHAHGGPLHLINVNVNQTRFNKDSDFQPDRQGWNLAIGPAGFNLGRSVWHGPEWAHKEELRLGQWVATSGAAFTTGAGARTGLGFSALLGLLGVRLGYWWRAGQQEQQQDQLRPHHALTLLSDEITGSFNPDHESHWYLSDGGHFENCAAYELIRRRLKRIVVADCGADPQYGFEDLANLVLKARLDFAAEITLLGAEDLDRLWVASSRLRALFAAPSQMEDRSGPGLLLARVAYPDDPVPGWMVIVKPRLPAELPVDLSNYALNEERFPQQSTLDQFYDESQWESMRKLGRLQGEQLASALLALPGWKDLKDMPPLQITGTPWSLTDEDGGSDTVSSAASQLKYYAPIAVALWTGFEFYSSYQQQQNKQAEEITRFALARIDKLEQEVFGAPGCRNAKPQCPTVPPHVELIRQMVTASNPPTSKQLVEMLDFLLDSAGAGKYQPDPAQIQSSTSSSLPAVPARHDIDMTEKERALVYVQIYDEASRPEASAFIDRLRQGGISRNATPGIENVRRTAAARQAKPPVEFKRDTVLYFHAEDKALAQWIGSKIINPKDVELRQLSGYESVRKGQIEVWLSPDKP